MSRCTLASMPGPRGRMAWGRHDEDYCADFFLMAKRTLDAEEWPVFAFHFLLGADWKLCCQRLGMDRGFFFHIVYRLQQKLGRAFRETEPYGLFPVDEYFASVRTGATGHTTPSGVEVRSLRPPVRKVA